MSLPIPWIDKIFLKLTLNYGNEFLNRWKGIEIEDVKADWAHELRGLQQNPKAIAYGLENCLDGKPPTVHEFRAVCIRRPSPALALPEPPADPERVAAELSKLNTLRSVPFVDHKAWARRLQSRHQQGDKLNLNQIRCFKNALGLE